MKKKIFFKLFIRYFIITLTLTIAILFFFFLHFKKIYINLSKENLKEIAVSLKPSIKNLIGNNKNKDLNILIKETAKQLDKRITIILPNGIVIADSDFNANLMENHSSRPEIKQALSGKEGNALHFSYTLKKSMLYSAFPIKNKNGKIITIIRISEFLKDINSFLIDIAKNISIIVFILFLGSVTLAFYFSKKY